MARILHVVPTYFPACRYGGPIKTVHELNKRLAQKGVEVTVYTTNIDGDGFLNVPLNQAVNVDGVKVFYFPVTFRPWQYSRAMHRVLAENAGNFDLVHVTSVFLSASTLGAHYAGKFNKPCIISPRGSLMKKPLEKKSSLKKKIYISLIEKRNLASASAIHFTVEKEKEEYLTAGLPLKKAIVIPNGFDFGEFGKEIPRGVFRKKFNISGNKKIVLFLSRLNWKKGLDTLIPAFAEIAEKKPEAVLVIAGPDDEGHGENLKSQISNLGIGDKIIFTGMLAGDDKIAAYKESNVFVLPSYSENFGMVVAEAMAAERPVVITKGVGISGEVERANAGIVVEKNDRAVADAILKILENPELAEQMGGNGRRLVEREFSLEKVAERWVEEYNNLI